MTFAEAQAVLISAGVRIASGLTAAEFERVEQKFGFRFPSDLREFLTIGLPVSDRWIDWRTMDVGAIRERLDWPFDGMCFDIKNNAFWLDEWGARPGTDGAAIAIARKAVSEAPVLIPICGHRYLPASPPQPGNPVFSVYQTDIIYYGADLLDYLQNEYEHWFGRDEISLCKAPREIPFWSRLEQENG